MPLVGGGLGYARRCLARFNRSRTCHSSAMTPNKHRDEAERCDEHEHGAGRDCDAKYERALLIALFVRREALHYTSRERRVRMRL